MHSHSFHICLELRTATISWEKLKASFNNLRHLHFPAQVWPPADVFERGYKRTPFPLPLLPAAHQRVGSGAVPLSTVYINSGAIITLWRVLSQPARSRPTAGLHFSFSLQVAILGASHEARPKLNLS
jgi:hypothetical protein